MAGNATIGSLRVQLGLDTANFESGIKRAQASTKSLSFGALESGMKGAAGSAGALGASLSGLGVAGLAVGAALGGVAVALTQTRAALAFGDEIGDTAAKLAVTTDALQEYRFAVHALGGEYKDADAALEGFAKTFGAAHAGLTKRAAKPFEALGLDPKSFTSTEDALQAVIKKIAALESTAEQAAIADKLGLSSMLPAIRAGADAIEDMRQKAQKLGYVMDSALIEKAGEANDKFEDLTAIMDVQFKSAMVELAPAILTIADALGQTASAASALFGKLREISDWSGQHSGLLKAFGDEGYTAKAGKAVGRFLGTDQVGPAMLRMFGSTATAKPTSGPKPAVPTATGSLITPETSRGGRKAAAGTSAEDRAAASADAIAAAARDELNARQALTGNITELAKLREAEIDSQLASDNARLKVQASEGKITQAAADQAASLNESAAVARKELVQRDASADLEQQMLDARGQIYDFYDEILSLEAAEAKTAGARNDAEKKALAYRQKFDRERLTSELEQKLARGEITESLRDAVLASQADAQSKVRGAEEQEAIRRLQQEVEDNFEDARDGVARMASAFKNNDWSGALSGLTKAIDTLKAAFAEGGTIGGKIGAVAGLASGVGSMIGGTAGAGLSGAASGAMAGFTVGGPVGAAIGGVIGGIAGLFGSSKAKKKAKAEAAAQKAAEEAARQARIAAEHRELEIQLMEAQGKAAEALAARRTDELAAMDASNRAMAEQLYALQDAAEAAGKAAALAASQRALEIDLMEAQGDATGALNARREAELATLDASLVGLQKAIYAAEDFATASSAAADKVSKAQDDLAEAYQKQAGDLRGVIDKFKAFSTSLRAFRTTLNATSPKGRYDAAKSTFEDTRAKALAGDENAIAKLQSTSEEYLSASKDFYASSPQFFADLDAVRAAVSATADLTDNMASSAEQQLAALDRLVEGQLSTRDATLSVAEALSRLTVVMGEYASLTIANAAAIDAQVNTIGAITAAQAPGTAPSQANDNTAVVDQLGAIAGRLVDVETVLAAANTQRAAVANQATTDAQKLLQNGDAMKRAIRGALVN